MIENTVSSLLINEGPPAELERCRERRVVLGRARCVGRREVGEPVRLARDEAGKRGPTKLCRHRVQGVDTENGVSQDPLTESESVLYTAGDRSLDHLGVSDPDRLETRPSNGTLN